MDEFMKAITAVGCVASIGLFIYGCASARIQHANAEERPQQTDIIVNGSTQQNIRVVAQPFLFDELPLYRGDDPAMTERLKHRADEQLRLIAPELANPEN